MAGARKTLLYLAISIVVFSLLLEEVDARRKVLRGRRIITRDYRRGTSIPAWAIVVAVAGGELIIGGVLYFIMRKVVLGSTNSGAGGFNTNSP